MAQPLHILLLEDSESDALLVEHQLRVGGYEPVCHRVDTEAGFKAALVAGGWGLIIADYNLPSFNALMALELLQQSGIDLPFIIVSGAIGKKLP